MVPRTGRARPEGWRRRPAVLPLVLGMPHRGVVARIFAVMHLGLVMTGGGARSAYQVGAVRAIAQILAPGPMPFDVVTGISAGAINSVALASGAEDFQGTTEAACGGTSGPGGFAGSRSRPRTTIPAPG